MPEASETPVLIAGAGPTGLLLACELQRLGVRVRIVDPKSGPTRESRALVVQARSLEIYDQLGLGAEAVREGRPARALRLWTAARERGAFAFAPLGRGRTPYPFLLVLEQSRNEALLERRLRSLGGEVAWGWRLESFEEPPGAGPVRARLVGPDGERRDLDVAYLCGADGAHSLVRHALGTPFEGTRSPRTLFVADVTASGKLDPAALNLKLSRASLLLAFPLPGPGHYRLIGMARGRELEGEAPTFEAVRPLVQDVFGVAVSEVRWFSHYRVSHRVARRFGAGRVYLLGDAAHVHSPVGGQGMNTGLGDAHNLAWKLAAVVRGQADPALLASYPAERRPFARALVRTTDRVFSLISAGHPASGLLRQLLPLAVGRVLGASGPLAELAFGTLAQLRLSYPRSPLSVGRAGRVRGGQRLPYVPGSGNFEALRQPGAALHIYGVPTPAAVAWTARREDVALRVFAYSRAARRTGLAEDAAYLVRPDGYVSAAQTVFDGSALDEVLRTRWHWRTPDPRRDVPPVIPTPL